MNPFAIAGMQLQLSGKGENTPYIRERLDYLMHVFPWVQMVVVSELAPCGPLPSRAEPRPGPTEDACREMAARHGIWFLPGSHFESEGTTVYNTATVIAPNGDIVGRYRKLFPFLPYERGVQPGVEFLTFDVPDVARFGVSICYDAWFPETSRTLATLGAEVILHPSMTTTIDRDVELAIARATAATNQCFFVDINGVGDLGNGRSIIAGPMGDTLYEAGTSEELIPLEIDLDRVRRSRAVGLRGLGQPLKSFRDAPVRFPPYSDDPTVREYLAGLGPLALPQRGSRAGLRDAPADPSPTPTPETEPSLPGPSP